MVLKIFLPNFLFFTQTNATFCINLILTLLFLEQRQFFSPKIGKKMQKIAIITSIPGIGCRNPLV
jgi:hypothetical protein